MTKEIEQAIDKLVEEDREDYLDFDLGSPEPERSLPELITYQPGMWGGYIALAYDVADPHQAALEIYGFDASHVRPRTGEHRSEYIKRVGRSAEFQLRRRDRERRAAGEVL